MSSSTPVSKMPTQMLPPPLPQKAKPGGLGGIASVMPSTPPITEPFTVPGSGSSVPESPDPAAINNKPESRRCPVYTERQRLMHEALLSPGGIYALGMLTYKFAFDDLAAEKAAKAKKERLEIPIGASYQKMVDDFNGNRTWLEVLHTVHKDVLEAMVLGTIGWRYCSDFNGFKKLFYPMDACTGIYAIAWVFRETNLCLSPNQWTDLQAMITRYINGRGVVIDQNSSQAEIDAAKEAAEIEFVKVKKYLNRKKRTFQEIHDDTRKGFRTFYYEQANLYRDMLDIRIPKNADPDVGQIQCPLQIGCAQDLLHRATGHESLGDMSSSSKSLKLTMSCLDVMGYWPVTLVLPIMKLYSDDQMEICEIGMTIVGNGLAHAGGQNMKQAGGEIPPRNNQKFLLAIEQIAAQPWTLENLAATNEFLEVLKNKKALEEFNRLAPEIQDIWVEIANVSDDSKALSDRVFDLQVAVDDILSKVAQDEEKAKAALESALQQQRFLESVKRWVEGKDEKSVYLNEEAEISRLRKDSEAPNSKEE